MGALRKGITAVGVAALAAVALPAGAAAAAANHFEVTPASNPVTPGVPFNFTVTAKDPTNATDTTYAGTVHFSSSDGDTTLPSNTTLTAGTGMGTFPATLNTPGCRRITANDTVTPTISGSSALIAVTGCVIVDAVNGADLTLGDPTQTGVLDLNGVMSECANPKSPPSVASAIGARAYDSYTRTNITNGPICFTAELDSGTNCATGITTTSYSGSFAPANPLTNYLGDSGVGANAGGTVISSSFTVPSGATFVDVVHARNAGFTCNDYSYTLEADKPFALTPPAATGTAAVGNVLGSETGTWADNPFVSYDNVLFSYQWRRCNTAGTGCADIGGAVNGTYEPTSADVGSTLRIRVGGTDTLGTSTADSPPTGVVTAPPPNSGNSGKGANAKKCKKKKKKHSASADKKKKCKKKR